MVCRVIYIVIKRKETINHDHDINLTQLSRIPYGETTAK